MNIAEAGPRSIRPLTILVAIALHVVVIYFAAVAFEIVPPIQLPSSEPKTIQAVRLNPPPPDPQPDTIKQKPPFPVRLPKAPPVEPLVDPVPVQPIVNAPPGPRGVDVGAEIREQPVARPLPGYPRQALNRGVEGRVVMSITIMPDGSVRDVRVVSAQPRGYFEEAAVSAVQRWRYRPSNVIRTNVIVYMDFELRDT